MKPYPQHCLVCGREITSGIDAHVRYTHEMDYDQYCKWFYDSDGSYAIYEGEARQVILTITRSLRPE